MMLSPQSSTSPTLWSWLWLWGGGLCLAAVALYSVLGIGSYSSAPRPTLPRVLNGWSREEMLVGEAALEAVARLHQGSIAMEQAVVATYTVLI